MIVDFERLDVQIRIYRHEKKRRKKKRSCETIGRGSGRHEPKPAEHRKVGWVQLHAKERQLATERA